MKNIKSPFVIILIGPPLSGKTTWIKDNYPDVKIISRDEIVMELHGTRDYNEAWHKVNQKNVNKILNERIVEANKVKEDVILDMTHMTSKRRRIHLNYFSNDYHKVGVIFPILSDDEYKRRNEIRIGEENKNIGMGIIKNMLSQYQTIKSNEGFNEVITLK